MKEKPDPKHVQKRLRLWLLSGKTITSKEAWIMFRTSRLAEYIRRCKRNDGLNIETKMVVENGDTFARYSLIKEEKVNRIKSGEYQRA